MILHRLSAIFIIIAAAVLPCFSEAAQPNEADFTIRNARFHDGETLAVLKLHYATLGNLKRDQAGHAQNAVLLLHGTTGTWRNFLAPGIAAHLFGPGQPLDAEKYFLIIPDGIGAGGSTKPSDGLGTEFPHYGYLDQVDMQHELVVHGLGIDHLHLVLGLSMGGMQTWLWGERYPAMMDALVPMGAMPAAIGGRNMLWREIIIRAIENDPDFHQGNFDPRHPPHLWVQTAAPLFAIMSGTATDLQRRAPTRDAAIALYDSLVANWRNMNAVDLLYSLKSSADYDPAPELDKITAPWLAINFANDMINPPELELMKPAIERLPHGQALLFPAAESHGHATLNHAEVWAPALAKFLGEIEKR